MLKYAIDAIKGGKAQVDIQLKKAMNKIVSVMNMKMKDTDKFFGPTKLPTPFPEIVSKRRKLLTRLQQRLTQLD